MDIFQRFAVYTHGVDVGPFTHSEPGDVALQMRWHSKLTPAQRQRLNSKYEAALHRRDAEGQPLPRYARLRRRFEKALPWRRWTPAQRTEAARRAWTDIIPAGPGWTGGRSADKRHPSRKHDTTARITRITRKPDTVPAWARDLPPALAAGRRRDRRQAARDLLAQS